MKNILENIKDFFYYKVWRRCLYDPYLNTRMWFNYCFNKHHFNLMKEAMFAYPFDGGYNYSLQRAHFKAMLHYMKGERFTTHETYEHMIKYIKIAISLLDIIIGDNPQKSTFHYTGKPEFTPCQDNPKLHEFHQGTLEYHCDVKVNLRTASRFVKNPQYIEFYTTHHPHELYELKARYLYHKLCYYFLDEIWD